MSNRSSSKQHGHANTDCLRPKSKPRAKARKVIARALRVERREKLTASYLNAVKSLNSEF